MEEELLLLLLCVLETPARATWAVAAVYYCVRSLQNASKLRKYLKVQKPPAAVSKKNHLVVCADYTKLQPPVSIIPGAV